MNIFFASLAVAAVSLLPGLAFAQQTPYPTTAFDVVPVGGATDPMIAASSTMVVVAEYNTLHYLEKNGTELVSPVPMVPLFQAGGAPVPNSYAAADMRIVYDEFRHRFWIAASIANNTNPCLATAPCSCPQDQHWAVAVTKTDDPRDGWWAYYFSVNSPQYGGGAIGFTDFPTIGIDEVAFYISGNVHGSVGCGFPSYSRVLAISADDAAAGYDQSVVRSEDYVNWTGSDSGFALQAAIRASGCRSAEPAASD
jgi:hypothetical protein